MPRITKPINILDSYIISTNVVDSSEQTYASDVTYGLGDLVKTSSTDEHRVWRSVHGITTEWPAGNVGFNPLAEIDPINAPVHWSFVSATNKYKMFDGEQASACINKGSITYTFGNAFPRFNLVSVLGLQNATSVQLAVLNAANIEIYNQTVSTVSNAGVNNMWRWLFWPRRNKKSVLFEDITPLEGNSFTITIMGANDDVDVGCALMVVGNSISFDELAGQTAVDYGASVVHRDFSIRQEDPYTGDYRFKRGPSTKDGEFTFTIPNSMYDLWNEVVADIGPEPFLFTATNQFDSTNLWGIFGKSRPSIDYTSHSRVTVEIRGLI